MASFGLHSSVMTNKNTNLLNTNLLNTGLGRDNEKCCICFQEQLVQSRGNGSTFRCIKCSVIPKQDNLLTQTITCYTPDTAKDTVSLLLNPNKKKKTIGVDHDLAIIPTNAIIDSIEFYSMNNFTTKGTYSLGLGQLNDKIMVPLIEGADAALANDKIGGCRQFIANAPTGRNQKHLVLYPSYVNITLEHPISNGHLAVIVYFHIKPFL